MKVALIMFYDENIKEYGDINFKINKMYCNKYNIDIIVSNEKNIKIDILLGKDYHLY